MDQVPEKTFFSKPKPEWKEETRLMFECASAIPSELLFGSERGELAEEAVDFIDFEMDDEDAKEIKLFVQANHSKHMKELFNENILRAFLSFVRAWRTNIYLQRKESFPLGLSPFFFLFSFFLFFSYFALGKKSVRQNGSPALTRKKRL